MDNSCKSESKMSKRRKADPSIKSRRYRDKLRAEVKALEGLIPVDKPTLHKKLDSQTIYRLAIAFLRMKTYFNAREWRHTPSEGVADVMLHVCSGGKDVLYGDADIKQFDNRPAGTILSSDKASSHSEDCSISNNKNATFENEDIKTFDDSCVLDTAMLYKIIDGFVLLASVDGTIIFVSENVSRYTGFSQIDLIHRCVYSIVHPEDHAHVRAVLEHQNIHQKKSSTPCKNQRMTETDTVLNFFCRIRCYHGNTSGYIKLHCGGKIQEVPDMPKTSQTSDSVVLLYCQPFLNTGNDAVHDSDIDIFWSKHDLDLKFKEIEETAVIGYTSADVCGKSLYQFVHPEDLCILFNIHRAVTKVPEVQTFYVRLQMKQGDWIWVHCKGKVICKHSKKFSIVFTHCPVGDADNVFIQQETSLRRQGLSNYLHATVHSSNHPDNHQHTYRNKPLQDEGHQNGTQGHSQRKYGHIHSQFKFRNYARMDGNMHLNVEDSLANGYKRDATVESSINIQGTWCPSSWHSSSDRHSPVLPNNHVTQKSTYRERQHRGAESSRGKCLEQKMYSMVPLQHTCSDNGTLTPRTCYEQLHGVHSVTTQPNRFPHPDCFNNYADTSFSDCFPHNGNVDNYGYAYPSLCQSSCPDKQVRNPASTGMYLPSPQKLPRLYPIFSDKMKQMYKIAEKTNPRAYNSTQSLSGSNGYDCDSGSFSPNLDSLYSSANVRFSMVCNTGVRFENPLLQQDGVQYSPHLSETRGNHSDQTMLAIKSEHMHKHDTRNCCAISEEITPASKHSVKYDIQASVYMRIVEAQNQDSTQAAGLELPVFESFIRYLNEKQTIPVMQ